LDALVTVIGLSILSLIGFLVLELAPPRGRGAWVGTFGCALVLLVVAAILFAATVEGVAL
jgi:hypothetical protein